MPASSRSLSVDEFAALVAAALSDIDVCNQAGAGGINDLDRQERHQTPPATSISVNHPLLSWPRKKPKFESWPTSSACYCGSPTDTFLDSPHQSIEFGDSEFATTSLNIASYLKIPRRTPTGTRMTTCMSEPTVIAASMSTVDLGNCLGLVGGACGSGSCAGTSSNSRHSANTVCNRNIGGKSSTINTTPTMPTFTLEVEGGAGLARSSDGMFDLESNVLDLSSSLRLPRTPSPLLRKSVPDLLIQDPPRNQCQQPESPRTPRKSFFSKLKKQLSSKTASTSYLPIVSTPPVPTISNSAHSDGSAGLFKLHLSLPLTPLSLSTPASPDPSRSPSPRFPFRTISASYKRESAPPTTSVVLEKPHSPNNWSPNLSPIDRSALRSGDEAKRRIHSFQDYNHVPTYPEQYPSPFGPEEDLQNQSLDRGEQHTRNNSILSLADCLVGESGKGSAQMNWMAEPKGLENMKTNSSSKGGGFKEHSSRSSQPFPTISQRDSHEMLSEPSRYSCESAPRNVRTSPLRPRTLMNGANSGTHAGQLEPRSASPAQPPPKALPAFEPEEEPPSYAPFVPLVFQHERLQQKLQKSVPLASFEDLPAKDYETAACIKSVTLKPFPPRTTSLSASTHVRQRTKSAPTAPHIEKSSGPKHNPAAPPIPMLPTHLASVPTTLRNQPVDPSKKDGKVERPTTAPANSTPNSTFEAQGEGLIPFPVVKETELVGEESMDSGRQRKPSKLKRAKPRTSLLSPLQSSVSTPPARLPSPLQSTENMNEQSNSHREGVSGSRTGTAGLNYRLSLSKHPYAQARSLEGTSPSPEKSDTKAEAKGTPKPSVTFVPSTTDGESSRLQSQTRRFKVAQTLMPLSPSSPTSNSGSGSGSEASTKSPVTPRSPLFWTVGGAAGIAAAVKSRIGLGVPGSTPTPCSEEERKAFRDAAVNSDSMSTCVVRTSDDGGGMKKEYTPPHPYSRSYLPTNVNARSSMEQENTTNDASPCKENIFHDQSPQSRSTTTDRPTLSSNRRLSMQTCLHHGVSPSKPPPVGPLPCTPDTVLGSGSDRYKVCDSEVPPSPVPSEYIKAFSRVGNDDGDFVSHPSTGPSYAPSQSSGSYEHDPEYEALLAANTRANVGELASMRNIGVGRRLMSGYPQPPSSRIDPTSSKDEGKRKRVHSEAARHPGLGGEWTLFLGNDDTPPRREDIIADLNSVPMTGIKTLSGVRARTKSESALNALGLGSKRSCGIKRARSSTLALGSSTHSSFSIPPVPKLVKKQVVKSEDWTLSLPLLPPGEEGPTTVTTAEADLSGTRQIPDPLTVSLIRDADSLAKLDDADDITIAESHDAPFVLDIDSLDFEDEDDSLLDFSTNPAQDRINLDHLLFSVPRVVSKGTGMECAKWGEEVDEEIVKKEGRRLSDGLDGMAGVSVRVEVNEDGESICVVDGLSLKTEEVEDGSDEGLRVEGHESADLGASDATKENIARLDALSADLKRFNELLKEGIGAATAVELKHAKSCGRLPSQTEANNEYLRVQQSLDTLRDVSDNSASTKPAVAVSVKDRVKSWTERSATLNGPPNVAVSSSSSSPPTSMAMKSRPPLPFAPSSPPSYSRPLGRSAALGIGPTAISSSPGRSVTGRAMTIASQTKPSHLPAIAAAIPDGVVGSGLKVGGNGRVISLSCSSAAAPVVASTTAGLVRVITKEKSPAAIIGQGKNDEESEGNGHDAVLPGDTKRNSASSSTSTDSFFTSFSSPSQAPTPPRRDATSSKLRRGSASSECSSSSNSLTPTATPPPALRIITSTTNPTRAHSPLDEVHTPSSSAMPTPMASSFPTVPPLPAALSSLGEDLRTVSRMLASTWISKNKASKEADESLGRDLCAAPRLSSASVMSVQTIVPEQQLSSDDALHLASEAERDSESTYSFYSARSSFEA